MPSINSLDQLLEQACPSIQYRLRLEVLHQSPTDQEMIALRSRILQDSRVQDVLSWQQPDGWLGCCFHGKAPGMECGIRLLCEKGVDREQPVLAAALKALEVRSARLNVGLAKAAKIFDERGLGGTDMIRAALFAHAGDEDQPLVREQIDSALETFRAVLAIQAIEDLAEIYRDKFIFREGARWPSIYHLRLLAFTHCWRTPENRRMIANSIGRLTKLSPIPDIYVRHKSQLIAPASVFMHDFKVDMVEMDAPQWMMWFHRLELLSRLGVVNCVSELKRQVGILRETLDTAGGWFVRRLNHPYFKEWNSYAGLMLENDWRMPARRRYDLTFRSLLIIHYSQD